MHSHYTSIAFYILFFFFFHCRNRKKQSSRVSVVADSFIESQPPPISFSVATPSQRTATPKQSTKKRKSASTPDDHTLRQSAKTAKRASMQSPADHVRQSSRKITPISEHPVIAMLNRSIAGRKSGEIAESPPAPVTTPSSRTTTPKPSTGKKKPISTTSEHTKRQSISKSKPTSTESPTDSLRQSTRKLTPVSEHPVIAMLNRSAARRKSAGFVESPPVSVITPSPRRIITPKRSTGKEKSTTPKPSTIKEKSITIDHTQRQSTSEEKFYSTELTDSLRQSTRKLTPVTEHPVIAMLNRSAARRKSAGFIESPPVSVITPSPRRIITPKRSTGKEKSTTPKPSTGKEKSTHSQSTSRGKPTESPTESLRRSTRKLTPVTEHPVIAMLNRSALSETEVTIYPSNSGKKGGEITLNVTVEEVNIDMDTEKAAKTPTTGSRRLTAGRRLTMENTSQTEEGRGRKKHKGSLGAFKTPGSHRTLTQSNINTPINATAVSISIATCDTFKLKRCPYVNMTQA